MFFVKFEINLEKHIGKLEKHIGKLGKTYRYWIHPPE